MEKYMTLTVDEHMAGQTVEKVLRTALGLTKKQISRAKFQADGIRKNGVQCRTTDIVQTGDQIMICIEAAKNDLNHLVSFCEDAHPLEILYEDEDILAVNKPAGILTHPSGAHYADTLSNQVSGYFHKKKNLLSRPPDRTARQRDFRYCFICKKSGVCAAASGST